MDGVDKNRRSLPLIDLTNDVSSSNSSAQYFDLARCDDTDTNHIPELIDLTVNDNNIPELIDLTVDDNNIPELIDLTVDNQIPTSNIPVIDLTCANDQFLNDRIQDNDMSNDDVQYITHRLKSFNLIDGKQQNMNDYIPTMDLTNHSCQSIDRNIPVSNLISDKNFNDDRRSSIVIKLNDDRVLKKPVDDVEVNCNNSPTSFQRGFIENNLRIPAKNQSYNATQNDLSKSNKTLNKNAMHIDIFSSTQKFHHRKEIVVNHPLNINFEGRKETILTNLHLTSNPEDVKKAIFTSSSRAKNSEDKYLSAGKSEQTSQNKVSDLLKPAHHPVPLRHSLGRSTVNTSQNVVFECTEAFKGQSCISTVSSIIRRKKSKSTTDISKYKPPNSKKQSTSRGSTFFFDDFKGFFRNFWIFLILVFIGLYNWI